MKVMNFRPDLSSTPWIQSDLIFHKQYRHVFILNTLFGGSLVVKQTLNCRESTTSMQTWSWGRRAQPEQGCHQQPASQKERPYFPPDSPTLHSKRMLPSTFSIEESYLHTQGCSQLDSFHEKNFHSLGSARRGGGPSAAHHHHHSRLNVEIILEPAELPLTGI